MPTSEISGLRPGDVVVVPFPYTDRLADKRRPALVISNQTLAKEGYVWVVMITSAVHRPLKHDVKLADIASAGLSAPSIVRPVKLACIEPHRIVRKSGRLAQAEKDRLLTIIRSFL
jgi:mRNA interferase MazF